MNVASFSYTTLSLSSSFHHDQRNALHLLPSECADVDLTSLTGHVCHTFSLQLLSTGKEKERKERNVKIRSNTEEWTNKTNVINIKNKKNKRQ